MKSSFSFSEFSVASSCLRRYKLQVLDALEVPGLQSADMSFGTGIHAGINALLKGLDGEKVFEIYWDSEVEKPLAYGRNQHYELMEIGLNLLSKFKRLHLKKYEYIEGEKRLYGSYKGLSFEGTPDAIVKYEGVLTLFDFKTTGYKYASTKIDTAMQLMLYAYLYYQNTGVWVQQLAYLPLVKSNTSIQGPLLKKLNRGEVFACLDDMVDYIGRFTTGTYPRNPNSCHMGSITCPYINLCWRQSDEGETGELEHSGNESGGAGVLPP